MQRAELDVDSANNRIFWQNDKYKYDSFFSDALIPVGSILAAQQPLEVRLFCASCLFLAHK